MQYAGISCSDEVKTVLQEAVLTKLGVIERTALSEEETIPHFTTSNKPTPFYLKRF
jgi:hypothetical protein